MAVLTLDKIIFRNNDSYLKMYKGSELIAEVESTPAPNYLTFTAQQANSTVNFNREGVTSEYSTDNGTTWNSGDNVTITLSNVGDKVMYRGVTNTTSGSISTAAFTLTGQVKASGNVNSMINNNPDDTSLNSKTYTFKNYFKDQSALKDINELLLPATTLATQCYFRMFTGCTGITSIPENLLSTTTLADYCYGYMFSGCTGLTTLPAKLLPATYLANSCYTSMFAGCTKITSIPENLLPATTLAELCYYETFKGCTGLTAIPANLLPATSLVNSCYQGMFSGCTGLTTLPAKLLPATSLNTNCYTSMFSGCTGLTNVPAKLLPATSLASYCYGFMFNGCTSLTTAPELPATTLTNYCYTYMFAGCTNLNKVVSSAKSISAYSCLQNWLNNVASTGDFYNLGEITYPSGASGIPSGWTVHAPQQPLTFTALERNSTIKFNREGVTSEYSTDGGDTWTSGDNVTVTLSNIGDKVMYRGVTNTTSSSSTFSAFKLTGQIKASGSVNSMINKDPYETSLGRGSIFREYFYNQDALKDISELTLPATTLTSNCYYKMFFSCNGLTNVPAKLLPVTTLASSCYDSMFEGCTSLTTTPTLPATTLADSCYSNMFNGCTSLTSAPELPAETLTMYCYTYMFSGCTNLNKVVTYAKDISATNCINSWLNNVASTGDFYNYGEITYSSGASGIPEGWTEHAPLQPLTLTALEANSTVKFNRSGVTSEYSTDNGTTWNSGDNVTITLSNIGDKVMYRGVTGTISYTSTTAFTLTGQVKASGSVNSMINKHPNDTDLNGKSNAFMYYFSNQPALKDISELLLPATTLALYCYRYMFYKCTGITTIPEDLLPATTLTISCYDSIFNGCTGITSIPNNFLHATTLANYCYQSMFSGCTGITTLPNIPTTALAVSCYCGMFSGCTGLTTIPTNYLPVTTLASSCYSYMFSGCTGLTNVPNLPATTLASSCYSHMFSGCTGLTTIPTNYLPVTTLASSCYDSMFSGCTGLTVAPTLSARSLAGYCYNSMFSGCTSLNKVVSYAQYVSTYYIENWLKGVASTGDFYNLGGASYSSGASGIPSGWTVHTTPPLPPLTFTALEANSTVLLNSASRAGITSEYSTDGGSTWTNGDSRTVTLSNVGDKVMYRGVTSSPSSSITTSLFTLTGQVKASGSVNSMINKDPDDTSLHSNNYAFISYFYNQSALKDISELILPATTLTDGCYRYMFYGCTGLTTLPNNFLPATSLGTSCYSGMFYGCTGLTTLPANLLPATSLNTNCYRNMFYNCTGLTTIPKNLLPATSLANYCYNHMFYGCTSLTQAPDLPAEASSNYCYASMFEKCSSLVDGGPKIWLRETSASNCLQLMFSECTKLNRAYIRVQSSDSFSNAEYWLDSVGSYGYIIVPALNSNYKYSGFPSGYNGLPDTWGVSDSKWDN